VQVLANIFAAVVSAAMSGRQRPRAADGALF
jgi:hypothetical protein